MIILCVITFSAFASTSSLSSARPPLRTRRKNSGTPEARLVRLRTGPEPGLETFALFMDRSTYRSPHAARDASYGPHHAIFAPFLSTDSFPSPPPPPPPAGEMATDANALICFTNCLLPMEDGSLVEKDLWVDGRQGVVLDAQVRRRCRCLLGLVWVWEEADGGGAWRVYVENVLRAGREAGQGHRYGREHRQVRRPLTHSQALPSTTNVALQPGLLGHPDQRRVRLRLLGLRRRRRGV